MSKYSIYYTDGSERNADNALKVVLDSGHVNAGGAGQIDADAFNFSLKKKPAVVIVKTDENGTQLTVKKLITFYGEVSLSDLQQAYSGALTGKYDNLPPGGGGEFEAGAENGFPFGSANGSIFPFGSIPPIVWLIAAGYSAVKLLETQSPVYAATGIYSYLHYQKNKKS